MSAPVRQAASTMLCLVTVLAAVIAATVLSTQSATAADCNVQNPDGSINYGCVKHGDPGDNGNGNGNGGIPGVGSGPDGGVSAPGCDLVAPATFCVGSNACWYLPSVVPYAPPVGDPPDGDRGNWKVRSCRFLDGGIDTHAVWMGGKNTPPPPPSLAEQAQTAFGQLTPAVGTLASNPAVRRAWSRCRPGSGPTACRATSRLLRLRPGRDRPAAEPPGRPRRRDRPARLPLVHRAVRRLLARLRALVGGPWHHRGRRAPGLRRDGAAGVVGSSSR